MEIVLIRHGATESNRLGRYAGSATDEPLSAAGAAEAAESRARFPFAPGTVFVSPMRRAVQTAEILFPLASLVPTPAFRELDFGSFEGKTAAELAHDPAYRAWVAGECASACPGGESMDDLVCRALPAFSALVQDAAARKEERLVVVSHGGVIMALLSRCAFPREPRFYRWHVKNCRGYAALSEWDASGLPRLTDCKQL